MKKIKLKPLADKVIVQQAEAETKTASGIIIPDTAQEKPQKGNVVAVGKGTKDDPITCLLYTSPSPRDATLSRMPSSA